MLLGKHPHAAKLAAHRVRRPVAEGVRPPGAQELGHGDGRVREAVGVVQTQPQPVAVDGQDDDVVVCPDGALVSRLISEPAHLEGSREDGALPELPLQTSKRVVCVFAHGEFGRPPRGGEHVVKGLRRVPAKGVEKDELLADDLHAEGAARGEFEDGGGRGFGAHDHGERVGVAVGAGADVGVVCHFDGQRLLMNMRERALFVAMRADWVCINGRLYQLMVHCPKSRRCAGNWHMLSYPY